MELTSQSPGSSLSSSRAGSLRTQKLPFGICNAGSRGENGRLTIGVYASLATGNMRATLTEYHRRFPDVDVQTVDGSHSRLIGALGRSAVDVAIMTNTQEAWDDRSLSLWTERVIVALPERHPLAESRV